MLQSLILSAALSATPYVMPCDTALVEQPKQESTIPVSAILPRRKERLSRYERRHPNLTLKEKAALRRLAQGKK